VQIADDRQTGAHKIVRPLPTSGTTCVNAVRSTLIASSLQAIRERGLFDQYAARLPARYHEHVIQTLAPTWLPIDVAMAHYQAADALELEDVEVLTIGRAVGERIQGSFLGTLIRGAAHAGVTPWTIVGKLDRMWSRVFDGGEISVSKLGPKDGRLSVRGLPLIEIDYFRIGWRGVLAVGVETIARKCYVREERHNAHDLDLLVCWV
jgi:hypothetical protein